MAKFCGGFEFDESLKLIDGVLCDAGATSVDVANAVTTCGQLWDGALFTKVVHDGKKIITLHNSEGEEVGEPVFLAGACGVGLDGRFFHVADGVVTLQDGFILTVNVTPTDATIDVRDVDSESVSPISGSTNMFLLSGIGDSYSVTASKDGYVGKSVTVTNNADQTVTLTLDENS